MGRLRMLRMLRASFLGKTRAEIARTLSPLFPDETRMESSPSPPALHQLQASPSPASPNFPLSIRALNSVLESRHQIASLPDILTDYNHHGAIISHVATNPNGWRNGRRASTSESSISSSPYPQAILSSSSPPGRATRRQCRNSLHLLPRPPQNAAARTRRCTYGSHGVDARRVRR